MRCEVIKTTHMIGRKWFIPVLEEIALGKFDGFNDFLTRAKTITPRILSRQLKELEQEGFIKKKAYKKEHNEITKYKLTEKGRELHKIIVDVKKFNVRCGNIPSWCMGMSCTECGKLD